MLMHIENGVKDLLTKSVTSDVDHFLFYWDDMNAKDPEHYPKEMATDTWIEQFWSWMEGE